MNSKAFLVSFLAVLTVLMLGFSSAANFSVSSPVVSFNDVQLNTISTTSIAGLTGETVPVRVVFGSHYNMSDVRVKVSLEGGLRDDVSASTSRFNLVDGNTYNKLLNLQLPADIKDTTKSTTLHVSIVSDDGQDVEYTFSVVLQRESYNLDILSVDSPLQVSSGDNVPVSVVVKNNGMEQLDDGYVIVSIPSLGIASKAYFGDLIATDNCDDNCDVENSVQKILYLKLPESTAAGTYDLQVKVYNADAVTTATKTINVGGSASTDVIAAIKSQDIGAGETKTYDLVIVNSGASIKVYNLQTVSGNALVVSAPAVITVAPQSSLTVPVKVSASKTADIGSYTFSVVVDGKQTVLNANVVEGSTVSNSVLALTIILAVIFVVLLVVLIVLLVRKEKPAEEVETSYY